MSETGSTITESYLSFRFVSWLQSKKGDLYFPPFRYIASEVECTQGKPDFLAVQKKPTKALERQFSQLGDSSSQKINILSYLHYNSPRSKRYLVKHTGYSDGTIARTLSSLLNSRLIIKTENDTFLLSNNFMTPKADIWAFELKVSDWKRALFQSLQCREYASYVYVVFPIYKKDVLTKNLHHFKRHKIGVLLFDPVANDSRLLLKSSRNSQISNYRYYYAYSNMLLRCHSFDNYDTSNHNPDKSG